MKRQTLRIAVLDEDANTAARLEALVRSCGLGVRRHDLAPDDALDPVLRDRHPDLVFYDLRHPRFPLDELVAMARRMEPPPQLIGLRHGPRESVAEPMQGGLDDVVSLHDEAHLRAVVLRSARCQAERQQLHRLRTECDALEQRCALLLEKQDHAIAYLHDGIHVYTNLAWKERFGFAPADDLEGLPIMDILPEEEREPVRLFLKQHRDRPDNAPGHLRISLEGADGRPQPLRMECSPVRYEGEDCLQVLLRPDTPADTSQLTQQFNYLAIYDIASGLYTRNYLVEQLEKALVKARSTRERHALVMISLDNYEQLAAQLGIAAADLLYADVGTELKTQLSLDDLLCRHDTSTYGLITPTAEPEALEILLRHLVSSVNEQEFQSGGQTVHVRLSCGAIVIDEHATDSYSLLTAACQAMQRAGHGAERIELVPPRAARPAATPASDDEQWAECLRDALKEGRLRLFFQPVVPAHQGEQRHIEASLRIARPEGGYFHPAEFMPAAIRTGYAKGLDRWVILRSLRMLQRYGDQIGPQGLLVQLTQGLLYQEEDSAWFGRQLQEHGVAPQRLVLQWRLGDLLQDPRRSSAHLRHLLDAGCRLCVAGCQDADPRLQQLDDLPVHYLKADEGLVQHLATDLERRGALNRLARHARQLGQKIIVPGILDAQQLELVKELAVDFLQGDFLQPASEQLPVEDRPAHDLAS